VTLFYLSGDLRGKGTKTVARHNCGTRVAKSARYVARDNRVESSEVPLWFFYASLPESRLVIAVIILSSRQIETTDVTPWKKGERCARGSLHARESRALLLAEVSRACAYTRELVIRHLVPSRLRVCR